MTSSSAPKEARRLQRSHSLRRAASYVCLLLYLHLMFALAFVAQCLWAPFLLLASIVFLRPCTVHHRQQYNDVAAGVATAGTMGSLAHALQSIGVALQTTSQLPHTRRHSRASLANEQSDTPSTDTDTHLTREASVGLAMEACRAHMRQCRSDAHGSHGDATTAYGSSDTTVALIRVPPLHMILVSAIVSGVYVITALVLTLLAENTHILDAALRRHNDVPHALLMSLLGLCDSEARSSDVKTKAANSANARTRLILSCIFGSFVCICSCGWLLLFRGHTVMPLSSLTATGAAQSVLTSVWARIAVAIATAMSAALYISHDMTPLLVVGHVMVVLSFAIPAGMARNREHLIHLWLARTVAAVGGLLLLGGLVANTALLLMSATTPGPMFGASWALRWGIDTTLWPTALAGGDGGELAISLQDASLRKLFQLLLLLYVVLMCSWNGVFPCIRRRRRTESADTKECFGADLSPSAKSWHHNPSTRRNALCHMRLRFLVQLARQYTLWVMVIVNVIVALVVLDAASFTLLLAALLVFVVSATAPRTQCRRSLNSRVVLPLVYVVSAVVIAAQYVAVNVPQMATPLIMTHITDACAIPADDDAPAALSIPGFPANAPRCAAVRCVLLLVELFSASLTIAAAAMIRHRPSRRTRTRILRTRLLDGDDDVNDGSDGEITSERSSSARRAKKAQIRAAMASYLSHPSCTMLYARAAAFASYCDPETGLVDADGFLSPDGILYSEWPCLKMRARKESSRLWEAFACSGECILMLAHLSSHSGACEEQREAPEQTHAESFASPHYAQSDDHRELASDSDADGEVEAEQRAWYEFRNRVRRFSIQQLEASGRHVWTSASAAETIEENDAVADVNDSGHREASNRQATQSSSRSSDKGTISIAFLLSTGSPGDGHMSFTDYLIFLHELEEFRNVRASSAAVFVSFLSQLILMSISNVLLLVMFAVAMTVDHIGVLNAVYLLFLLVRVWGSAGITAVAARRQRRCRAHAAWLADIEVDHITAEVNSGSSDSEGTRVSGYVRFCQGWRRALVLFTVAYVAVVVLFRMHKRAYGALAKDKENLKTNWFVVLGLESSQPPAALLSYLVLLLLTEVEGVIQRKSEAETLREPQAIFQALEWGMFLRSPGAAGVTATLQTHACLAAMGIMVVALVVAAPRSILIAGLAVLYVIVLLLQGSGTGSGAFAWPRRLLAVVATLLLGLYVNAALVLSAAFQLPAVNIAVRNALAQLHACSSNDGVSTGAASGTGVTTCALEMGLYPTGYLGASTVPLSLLPWYVAVSLAGYLCQEAIVVLAEGNHGPHNGTAVDKHAQQRRSSKNYSSVVSPHPRVERNSTAAPTAGATAVNESAGTEPISVSPSELPLVPECHRHSSAPLKPSLFTVPFRIYLASLVGSGDGGEDCETSKLPGTHRSGGGCVTYLRAHQTLRSAFIGRVVPCAMDVLHAFCVAVVLLRRLGSRRSNHPHRRSHGGDSISHNNSGDTEKFTGHPQRETPVTVFFVWAAQIYACAAQPNLIGACYGLLLLLDGITSSLQCGCRLFGLYVTDLKGGALLSFSLLVMSAKYMYPLWFVRSASLSTETLSYIGLGGDATHLSGMWPPLVACFAAFIYTKTQRDSDDVERGKGVERADSLERFMDGRLYPAYGQASNTAESSGGGGSSATGDRLGHELLPQSRQYLPGSLGHYSRWSPGSAGLGTTPTLSPLLMPRHAVELASQPSALHGACPSVSPLSLHSRAASPSRPQPRRHWWQSQLTTFLAYLTTAFLRETLYEQVLLLLCVTLALSVDSILGFLLLAHIAALCLSGRTRVVTSPFAIATFEVLLSLEAAVFYVCHVGLPAGVADAQVPFLHPRYRDARVSHGFTRENDDSASSQSHDGETMQLPAYYPYLGFRFPVYRVVLLLILLVLHRAMRYHAPAVSATQPRYLGYTNLHEILRKQKKQMEENQRKHGRKSSVDMDSVLRLPTTGYDRIRNPRNVMDLVAAFFVLAVPASILGFITGVLLSSVLGVAQVVVALFHLGCRRWLAWRWYNAWKLLSLCTLLATMLPQLIGQLPVAALAEVSASSQALAVLGLSPWPNHLLLLEAITVALCCMEQRVGDELFFADYLVGLLASSRAAAVRHRQMWAFMLEQHARHVRRARRQEAALQARLALLAYERRLLTEHAPRRFSGAGSAVDALSPGLRASYRNDNVVAVRMRSRSTEGDRHGDDYHRNRVDALADAPTAAAAVAAMHLRRTAGQASASLGDTLTEPAVLPPLWEHLHSNNDRHPGDGSRRGGRASPLPRLNTTGATLAASTVPDLPGLLYADMYPGSSSSESSRSQSCSPSPARALSSPRSDSNASSCLGGLPFHMQVRQAAAAAMVISGPVSREDLTETQLYESRCPHQQGHSARSNNKDAAAPLPSMAESIEKREELRRSMRGFSHHMTKLVHRLTNYLATRSLGVVTARRHTSKGSLAKQFVSSVAAYGRIRTAYVCAFAVVLHFALTGTVIDMFLSLSMLLYALIVLPPAAGCVFWRGTLIYAVLAITAKSLLQVLLLHSGPDAASLQMPPKAIRAIDALFLCTGYRTSTAVSETTATAGIVSHSYTVSRAIILRDVILSFIVFVLVLFHREVCIDYGVYKSVRTLTGAQEHKGRKERVLRMEAANTLGIDERGAEEDSDVAEEQEHHAQSNETGQTCRALRGVWQNLHQPRGVGGDFYALQFILDLVAIILFLWAYFALTSRTTSLNSNNVIYSVTENLLPGPFILILFGMVLVLCVERVAYVTNCMTAKITLHVALALLYHAIFFTWRIISARVTAPPSRVNTNVGGSGGGTTSGVSSAPEAAAIALFSVKCVSLWVSAIQIREGYPLHRRHDAFTTGAGLCNWLGFVIFRAIPFLFELRLFLDWSFSRTALKVQHWMLLEDIHYWIYKRYVDIHDLHWTSRRKGSTFPWLVKCYQGIVGCVAILIVVFFPLVFYSTFSSQTGRNYVVRWQREITLGHASRFFVGVAADVSSGGSTAGAEGTQLADLAAVIAAVPQTAKDGFGVVGSLQTLRFPHCSAVPWSITEPGLDRLLHEVNSTLHSSTASPFVISTSDLVERHAADTHAPHARSGASGSGKVVHTRSSYTLPVPSLRILQNVLEAFRLSTERTMNAAAATSETDQETGAASLVEVDIPLPGFGAPLAINTAVAVDLQTYATLDCSMRLHTVGKRTAVSSAFSRETYWCVTCSETPRPSASAPPPPSTPPTQPVQAAMFIVASSTDVAVLRSSLSFLPNIGVIALYTTFVFAFSSLIRSAVSGDAHRIVLMQVANPEPVAELLRYLYLARSAAAAAASAHSTFGHSATSGRTINYLLLEQQLFLELLDLLRSPERLVKASGLRVNDYSEAGEYREEIFRTCKRPF